MEIVYDTGALLAAERRDRTMQLYHTKSLTMGFVPLVPFVVLAQAWRGGPQAEISRILKGCDKQPMDEGIAREAGQACAVAGASDIVDAVVVVWAAKRNAVVVTSDPGDLLKIGDATGTWLRLRTV